MNITTIDPSKEIFYDGILTIISDNEYDKKRTGRVGYIILSGQYDAPVTLEQIELNYPDVSMVIYEEALEGYVYKFGNHRVDGKKVWEKTGETKGYA